MESTLELLQSELGVIVEEHCRHNFSDYSDESAQIQKDANARWAYLHFECLRIHAEILSVRSAMLDVP